MSYCKFALLAVLVGLTSTSVRNQENAHTYGEIRQLLAGMKENHSSTKQLAVLFRVGDDKIADLIQALRDPDKEVRLNAQIVIRYLGNEQGMNAWRKMFEGAQDLTLTGPIPIPLSRLDYDFLRAQYLKEKMLPEPLMDAYLFALAFEGSDQAKELLSEIILNANRHGFRLHASRYVLVNSKKISQGSDLAMQVLRRTGVVEPADYKHTTATVTAYSTAKDKALVEIYVNRGPLAEEWYHVVVKRADEGWTVFSITQIAVS